MSYWPASGQRTVGAAASGGAGGDEGAADPTSLGVLDHGPARADRRPGGIGPGLLRRLIARNRWGTEAPAPGTEHRPDAISRRGEDQNL